MVGVDEVGRGCWAGPLLVVAARAKSDLPAGLKDSKLMSQQRREEILNKLSISCEFGEGWVSASEIDKLGLAGALKLGVARALKIIQADTDEQIIMDGKVDYIPKKFKNASCLVGGDNLVPVISAASVHAKVTRDKYMSQLARKYPKYGFDKHVGYGTKVHRQALSSFGFIKYVHRISYSPISKMLESV